MVQVAVQVAVQVVEQQDQGLGLDGDDLEVGEFMLWAGVGVAKLCDGHQLNWGRGLWSCGPQTRCCHHEVVPLCFVGVVRLYETRCRRTLHARFVCFVAGASVADSGLELDDMFLPSGSEGFSDGDLDGVRGIDTRHGAPVLAMAIALWWESDSPT
jgi:hypothetical protein